MSINVTKVLKPCLQFNHNNNRKRPQWLISWLLFFLLSPVVLPLVQAQVNPLRFLVDPPRIRGVSPRSQEPLSHEVSLEEALPPKGGRMGPAKQPGSYSPKPWFYRPLLPGKYLVEDSQGHRYWLKMGDFSPHHEVILSVLSAAYGLPHAPTYPVLVRCGEDWAPLLEGEESILQSPLDPKQHQEGPLGPGPGVYRPAILQPLVQQLIPVQKGIPDPHQQKAELISQYLRLLLFNALMENQYPQILKPKKPRFTLDPISGYGFFFTPNELELQLNPSSHSLDPSSSSSPFDPYHPIEIQNQILQSLQREGQFSLSQAIQKLTFEEQSQVAKDLLEFTHLLKATERTDIENLFSAQQSAIFPFFTTNPDSDSPLQSIVPPPPRYAESFFKTLEVLEDSARRWMKDLGLPDPSMPLTLALDPNEPHPEGKKIGRASRPVIRLPSTLTGLMSVTNPSSPNGKTEAAETARLTQTHDENRTGAIKSPAGDLWRIYFSLSTLGGIDAHSDPSLIPTQNQIPALQEAARKDPRSNALAWAPGMRVLTQQEDLRPQPFLGPRSKDSLLVVPLNDSEAYAIGAIAQRIGMPSLPKEKLPHGFKMTLELAQEIIWNCKFRGLTKAVVVEIPGPPEIEALFGHENIELIPIDHHIYGQNKDRFHRLSSLEQFVELIGYSLSPREMLVAINDRSFLPGLFESGLNQEEALSALSKEYRSELLAISKVIAGDPVFSVVLPHQPTRKTETASKDHEGEGPIPFLNRRAPPGGLTFASSPEFHPENHNPPKSYNLREIRSANGRIGTLSAAALLLEQSPETTIPNILIFEDLPDNQATVRFSGDPDLARHLQNLFLAKPYINDFHDRPYLGGDPSQSMFWGMKGIPQKLLNQVRQDLWDSFTVIKKPDPEGEMDGVPPRDTTPDLAPTSCQNALSPTTTTRWSRFLQFMDRLRAR